MEFALHDSLLPSAIIVWLSTFFDKICRRSLKFLMLRCWGCTLSGSLRCFVRAEPFNPWP